MIRNLKIAVLTLVTGEAYQKKWAFTQLNKANYCRRHGYDFICETELPKDFRRPASWYKVVLVAKHLRQYDYVFWMDADALFARKDRRLETLFQKEIAAGYDFVFKKDWNHLNMGVFLARRSDWSLQFLNYVMKSDRRAVLEKYQRFYQSWWEQSVVVSAYESSAEVRSHFYLDTDNRLPFNQYPHRDGFYYSDIQGYQGFFKPGDVVLHFCNSGSYPRYSRAWWVLKLTKLMAEINRWIATAVSSRAQRSNPSVPVVL